MKESKKLLKHENSGAAGVTLAIAAELSRRFPPKVIGAKIDELINAKMPLKKGETEADRRVNERAVESGLKMLALFQNMADQERRNGLQLPPPSESEEDTIRRLLKSPAAMARLEDLFRKAKLENGAVIDLDENQGENGRDSEPLSVRGNEGG